MSDQDQNFLINFSSPQNLSADDLLHEAEEYIEEEKDIIPDKPGDTPLQENKEAKDGEEADLKEIEVSLSLEKVELIKKIIQETQSNLKRISCFLGEEDGKGIVEKIEPRDQEEMKKKVAEENDEAVSGINEISPDSGEEIIYSEKSERVLEGVFDGQNMIGEDGKEYIIPPNYASKSKLVEGDILKLTIDEKGSFLFKQIGPMERQRVVGILEKSETDGGYRVVLGEKRWKILSASVTYFKGEIGDEVVILVPKNAPSRWAAVENIIKDNN
jgi:hypothetical protein